MTRFFGRRAVLAALAMPFVTQRAHARAPFRLRGDPQPLLSPPIVDESGRDRRLEDFGSRVILLNIWATWCPPCRKKCQCSTDFRRGSAVQISWCCLFASMMRELTGGGVSTMRLALRICHCSGLNPFVFTGPSPLSAFRRRY